MAPCRYCCVRDCSTFLCFIQTHPWMGWIAQLGNQSPLWVPEWWSDSTVILLKCWAWVYSSRISAGNSVDGVVAVFVDGRTAPILGEDNFPPVLRCRGRSSSTVGSAFVR